MSLMNTFLATTIKKTFFKKAILYKFMERDTTGEQGNRGNEKSQMPCNQ